MLTGILIGYAAIALICALIWTFGNMDVPAEQRPPFLLNLVLSLFWPLVIIQVFIIASRRD